MSFCSACINFVKCKLIAVLGALSCLLIILFVVITTPVFIFRVLVTQLAKKLRPDLGDIVGGQSAMFVADYMAETTPRSNVVVALIIQGHLTLEEIQARVLRNWIATGENKTFEKFQQYPVYWLGFAFWKNASQTFSLDNHVSRYSGKETQITSEQLTGVMETLLNKRTLKYQSPWELIVIENYKNPNSNNDPQSVEPHSVLIFKWHHCLVDAVGVLTALATGIFEQQCGKIPQLPRKPVPLFQKLLRILTFPVSAFLELSYVLSHMFRSDPFKVPDGKKNWYQICAKSGPISIQKIKDIKNAFGVSYTSVLLSAFSAAINKTLKNPNNNKPMLCLSVLPVIGNAKRKLLSNHMTGAAFDLPYAGFGDSVERLRVINRMLEKTKTSIAPILGQYYTTLMGAHTCFVNRLLTKNHSIPIGLTNFAAVQNELMLDEKRKCIRIETVAGSHAGVTGVAIISTSLAKSTEIFICAESALMTREQADAFLSHVKNEIQQLYDIMPRVVRT